MKRLLIFCLVLLISSIRLLSQIIENPGFEFWEDDGTVADEPVNWSSIKTSDGGEIINNAAPVIWGKSNDAHSGDASLELETKLTYGTIVVTGTITNGRIHAEFDPQEGYIFTNQEEEKWHTVCTERPDSVVIWCKYTPVDNDTAQVKVLLHVDEGRLPMDAEAQANRIGYAQINITGTVDSWTRFSSPFIYYSQGDPEYVLVVITSGAGTEAIVGSLALFDDMELIINPESVEEYAVNNHYIYSDHQTIYFDRLPFDYKTGSKLAVYDLNGSLVYSSTLSSEQLNLSQTNIRKGLYFIRIIGSTTIYTQKILF